MMWIKSGKYLRKYDRIYLKGLILILILFFSVKTVYSFSQKGTASWYGKPFHGRKTASGEVYDMNQMTAAHKTLPFGTRLKVTDLNTGRYVFVTVNDRGPFVKGRIIDLSRAAADELGILKKGTAYVLISTEADNAVEKIYVQAGAFRAKNNAMRLKNKLSRFDASVAREGGLYKVLIGPLKRGRVKTVLRALRAMGIKGVIRHVSD